MKNLALLGCAVFAAAIITSCNKLQSTPEPVSEKVDSLKIGLILYYPYNNSGVDSSGMGNGAYVYHNLTSTTNRFNKPNTAFSFDGSTSYMITKDNSSLRLSNTDYTMNEWVFMSTYNTSYGCELLCKRGPGSANGWNFSITGTASQYPIGVTGLQVSGGFDPLALGSKQISLNQWHMLTTVYNFQKKQVSFYIDGTLDNVTNNIPTPSATSTADIYIGQDSQGSGATAYYFQGKLDDIRIYNRALNIGQIQKLYNLTY